MTSPEEILQEIDARLEEALTLTVGRIVDDTIEASHLALDRGAAHALREQCHVARDRISEGTPASYTATAELDDGEFFVIDDAETLADLGAFRSLVDNLGAIPQVTPADLDLTIKLYAVAVGDETDRVLFVRSTNPRLTHRAGRFLAIGRERLARIEEPVFSFSPDFHFVLGRNWAVVLDQRSFEVLFRQIGLVAQHVSTWIEGITEYLPMGATSIESLREVALRDSRTWRRLRDIEHRGHLAHVSLEQVAEYAGEVGLDSDKVVVDGQLVFDPSVASQVWCNSGVGRRFVGHVRRRG
ncbi:MAG: hypothetical protein F4Z22_02435 [Acidimicrobiia bacterium]|nr:hypothetical protein [Acidimicrobiia bacterium]